MELLFGAILWPLVGQATNEPPEVKYNVAIIAAVASLVVACITAVVNIIGFIVARMTQRALQTQQAELTLANQTKLANLQTKLKLETDVLVESAKSNLAEKTQARLEMIRADLVSQNQVDLERLRAQLSEQGKERDARRDYEYDAHKRLYEQCEPLLFQLAELAEHSYYRVFSLARSARLGKLPKWLDGEGYYLRSTIYKLIAPLVVFRQIQQRLTFVDLTLDRGIANQYRLLKLLYLTFTDPFDFAKLPQKIEYDPDVEDWEVRRRENPQKYWRQGLYLGALDNAIDALIKPGRTMRLKTYGEFEAEFLDDNSKTRSQCRTVADILLHFHPQQRPVLWRMLWTQTFVCKAILEQQANTATASKRIAFAALSPKLPPVDLDWRQRQDEATDEEVLNEPLRVAQEYLRARLPDVFGT